MVLTTCWHLLAGPTAVVVQEPGSQPDQAASTSDDNANLERDVSRFARQAAGTFAPRPSTATKNPAVKGSTLYYIFEVQAWLGLVAGGLLSFNILYPTDEPSIPRLLG